MHPHPMAASALILLPLAVTLGYVTACAVWPFANCRKCGGAGRHRSPSGRAWRYCHRCQGPAPGSAPAAASGTTSATCTKKAADNPPPRKDHPVTVIILITLAVAYLAFHAGHAHANYRHGRARGHRGINLYWSSARGPWISVPGPFGTRIGHKL